MAWKNPRCRSLATAQLAGRYITGRRFPDKAIDLIDEACATVKKMRRQEEEVDAVRSSANAVKEAIVTPNHVAQVGILFLMTLVYCFDQLVMFVIQIDMFRWYRSKWQDQGCSDNPHC